MTKPNSLDDLLDEKPGQDDEQKNDLPPDADDDAGKTGDGDGTPSDDEGAGGKKDDEGLTGDEKDAVIAALQKDMAEMRAVWRNDRRQSELLRQQLNDTKKQLEESGTIPPASKEDEEKLKAAQEKRADELETFLESMRISQKYGDVDTVVSQARANDILEIMGKSWASKNNISAEQGIRAVTDYVWLQVKNPYRFLYEKIKEAHPDFAKANPAGGAGKKGAPSIANLDGGSGSGKGTPGGWTSAKIDALPENRLHEVPADVYDKYMKGTLD